MKGIFVVFVILYFCMPANKCQLLQITPIKSTEAVDVATLLNMFVDTATYPGMSIKVNAGSPGMFGTFTGLFRRCPRILARRQLPRSLQLLS